MYGENFMNIEGYINLFTFLNCYVHPEMPFRKMVFQRT
jgi:hypothetical protein